VLLKGVGSVALRIALEGGVNVVGGVAGEALGSVATGETVNWTGALMGALIGAGIGAGLGIAGAIRGRIKVGGLGEPVAPAPPRPAIEAPSPAPAGRLRSALEAAKILAPRRAPVMPEVNTGSGAAGEVPAGRPSRTTPPAPAETTPVAEPTPPPTRKLIGFGERGTTSEQPPSDTRNLIGFGDRGTVTEPTPAPPTAAEAMPGAQPQPAATPTRKLIGFGERGTTTERPPSDTRNLIGFGDRGTVTELPPAAAEATPAAQPTPPRPAPRSMTIEPTAPRAGVSNSAERVRAGGRAVLEIRASGEASGFDAPGSRPRDAAAPRAAANEPAAQVTSEPGRGRAPAKTSPATAPASLGAKEPAASLPAGTRAEPIGGTEPGAASTAEHSPKAVEPSAPSTTREPGRPSSAARARPAREIPQHVTGKQRARLSRLLETAEDAGLNVGDEQLDEIARRLAATKNVAQADEVLASLERQLEGSIEVKGSFRAAGRVPGGSRVGDVAAELPEGTNATGTTTKPRVSVLTDAEQLAAELTRRVGPRPPGHEAHHVIPKGMEGAEEARGILRDAGIGINDVENGVWLPKDTDVANPFASEIHSKVHTSRAIRVMTEILREGAKEGPDGVRRALQSIRSKLLDLRFER
jgi:hypothetical protein